jgi:type IX secretion system PorP/SprF family membrane protein
MRNKLTIFCFFACTFITVAQQLPYYSQYKAFSIALNPAVTGTKRLLDVRANYRKQWVNFDNAPTTQNLQVNSRLFKGLMGFGLGFMRDNLSVTSRNYYSFSYAFHIRYPDIELSMGLSANLINYRIDYSKLNFFSGYDQVIQQGMMLKDNSFDMGAGLLLYNDRFHFGFSALDLVGGKGKFHDPAADSISRGTLKNVPHTFVSVGYNWDMNRMFIWENTILANLVESAPLQIEYNLRLHYKQAFFLSGSIRRKDAIGVGCGYTFKDQLQIGYTYDIGTSQLKLFHSNTHEITIVFSSNLEKYKRYGSNKGFKRQKYGYMF